MKKLSLKLDELKVESFDTQSRARRARGTVLGNSMPPDTSLEVCGESDGCVVSLNPWECTYADCGLDTGWRQCGYSYGGTCGASPPISAYEPCEDMLVAGAGFPYDCV